MGTTTYPETIDEVLASMGEAGTRLNAIDAIEAGAGNISCAVNWDLDLTSHFDSTRELDLPWTVPNLVGYTVLVTGSGCRLRDVASDAAHNVGAVVIHDDGKAATLHFNDGGNFLKPTSEFNSHLAVHDSQVEARHLPLSAVIHAQPPHLVMMTHNPAYQTTETFNKAILRWEPETIVQLPAGVVYLPYMVPGSPELMENNVEGLREAQITIWSKHGLMARSDISPLAACDKIEYAETGAMYEMANVTAGGVGDGLSAAELKRVIDAFGVETTIF